jgi:hypothetical protein
MEASGQYHALTTSLPGKNPSTQSIGGFVGPRAHLTVTDKRKISCLCQDSNLWIIQPIA